MDATQFQSFITMVAVIIGVIVYWRKGGNKASEEANSALLQLTTANEKTIKKMQEDISELQFRERNQLGEIGKLQGIIQEKDKRIEILERVRVTLDPELAKALAFLSSVANKNISFMEKSDAREDKILLALQEIGMFMKNLNNHFALAEVSKA